MTTSASSSIIGVRRQSHILALGNQGNLFLDGQFLGRADEGHFLRQVEEKWTVVSALELSTADGHTQLVASHGCQYYQGGNLYIKLPEIAELNGYPVTYWEVWNLVRQSFLSADASGMQPVELPQMPMRRNQRRGVLTNGRISIPLQRPRYGEWRRHPEVSCLKAVTAANWQLMLEILEGTYLDGLIEPDLVNQISQFKAQRKQQAKLERRRQQFAKAQCLRLEDVSATVVADNILYSYLKDGNTSYAVDSFNYGVALYFFECPKAANEWLNRRVSAEVAKTKAVARITHHPGWSSKAKAYLPQAVAAD